MSQNDTNESGASPLRLILVVVLMAALVSVMFGGMDWIEHKSGQYACEERYGEEADYIGETSAFGGSAICEVDGEQKYASPSMGWLFGSDKEDNRDG